MIFQEVVHSQEKLVVDFYRTLLRPVDLQVCGRATVSSELASSPVAQAGARLARRAALEPDGSVHDAAFLRVAAQCAGVQHGLVRADLARGGWVPRGARPQGAWVLRDSVRRDSLAGERGWLQLAPAARPRARYAGCE